MNFADDSIDFTQISTWDAIPLNIPWLETPWISLYHVTLPSLNIQFDVNLYSGLIASDIKFDNSWFVYTQLSGQESGYQHFQIINKDPSSKDIKEDIAKKFITDTWKCELQEEANGFLKIWFTTWYTQIINSKIEKDQTLPSWEFLDVCGRYGIYTSHNWFESLSGDDSRYVYANYWQDQTWFYNIKSLK